MPATEPVIPPTDTAEGIPAADEAASAAAEPPVASSSAAATPPADAAPAEAAAAAAPAAVPGMNPAAVGQDLRKRFPALFGGAPKPLKLRSHVDIQERAPGVFSKQVLTAFFRRYTSSTSYLLAVARGRQRFDLDGKPAGEISDEHRQIALDELARRGVSTQSRRELEEQQRHNRAGLLHDWERTTLTRANFCALKQVADEELDGLLEIARREAAERPPQPPRMERREPRPERQDGRGDARGGQHARGERPDRPARPRGPGGPGGGPRRDEGRRR